MPLEHTLLGVQLEATVVTHRIASRQISRYIKDWVSGNSTAPWDWVWKTR